MLPPDAPSRSRRASAWLRRLRLVVAPAALVAAVVLQTVLATPPAQAVGSTGCNYGTGGSQAASTCWLDFTGYSDATARSAGGQAFSISLPGGYTASFTVHAADVAGRSTTAVHAATTPTWGGAYLGQNGHYDGIGGRPALYTSSVANGGVLLTVSNIHVTDVANQPVAGFALLAADAESSNGNGSASGRESLVFRSDVPLNRVDGQTVCGGGLSGIATGTVTCIGDDPTSGAALFVQAVDPTSVSVQTGEAVGSPGMQGVAFAFVHASVKVDLAVSGRLDSSDAFSATITSGSTVLGSGSTGSGSSASTGATAVVPSANGSAYGLAVAATSGDLANYTTAWSCANSATTSSTSLPTGSGGTKSLSLVAGDSVACTVTLTPRTRALSITATATAVDRNGDGLTDSGDRVGLTYTVTNTGGVALGGIAVTDAAAGTVVCQATTLAAGASTTCTATHDVTAADETARAYATSAVATGSSSGSSTVVVSSAATTSTAVVAAAPQLTTALTVDRTRYAAPGDVLGYTATVTNTGNVGLAAVAVAPSAFSGTGTAPTFSCTPTALAPAATATCTATYLVTQADVDAGQVQATVRGSALRAGGASGASAGSTAVAVQGDQVADVSFALAPDRTSVHAAGDVTTWTFTARNTGTVTLDHVGVVATASSQGTPPAVRCDRTSVAPGQTATCVATTTTALADLDHPSISLSGALQAQRPGGATVASSVESAHVDTRPTSAIALRLDRSGAAPARAGQLLHVTYVATNTGTSTLRSVAVAADRGAASLRCAPATGVLDPGAAVECEASIVATDADVRAGGLQETATATAVGAQGAAVHDAATTTTPLRAVRSIGIALRDPDRAYRAGERATIPFTLRNTGTLHVTTTGATARFGGRDVAITCEDATVAPGAATRCSATVTVTADDVAAGAVRFSVSAGSSTGVTAQATVRTVDDTPRLAFTGSSAMLPVGAGVVALLAGAVLLLAGRRRRVLRR